MKFVVGDIVQLKRNHPHGKIMEEFWFTTAFEILECFYVKDDWRTCYHIKPLGNLDSFKNYGSYIAIAQYEEPYWDFYGEFAIVDVAKKELCQHPNKKYVVNGIDCQYYFCPDCKKEVPE